MTRAKVLNDDIGMLANVLLELFDLLWITQIADHGFLLRFRA